MKWVEKTAFYPPERPSWLRRCSVFWEKCALLPVCWRDGFGLGTELSSMQGGWGSRWCSSPSVLWRQVWTDCDVWRDPRSYLGKGWPSFHQWWCPLWLLRVAVSSLCLGNGGTWSIRLVGAHLAGVSALMFCGRVRFPAAWWSWLCLGPPGSIDCSHNKLIPSLNMYGPKT